MKTKEKQTTKIRKSVAGILFMLVCIFAFSWVVNADSWYVKEEEGAHETVEDSMRMNSDGIIGDLCESGWYGNYEDWYYYGRYTSGSPLGYYTFTYKTLENEEPNKKITIYLCEHDSYGYTPIWYYSGKVKDSLKTNIGRYRNDGFYILIAGPQNMRYKFGLVFHESKNWESEGNQVFENADMIDFNRKIHGTSSYASGGFDAYDNDCYLLDSPTTGEITFQMDRTPKKKHTVRIYDLNRKVLWEKTLTSESHVSKKLKVKSGKVYIKIYGTNDEQYDFLVTHKRTTNEPSKTKLTGLWSLNKAIKVAWKKSTGAFSGYQVQYAKDKKFTKGVSTKTIGGKNNTKVTISGLENYTPYYFRVRTYNKVNNKTYYSGWSDFDSKRTK